MSDTGRSTPEPQPSAPASAHASAPPGREAPAPSGRAILVVDDEPGVRRFVAEALRGRGHEVIAVPGGREALRAVYDRSKTPDLVVSDIDMPAMTGVELAVRLSADRPGIRVVLMTGRPDSARLAGEHPEIVSAVLLKPFSLDALVAAVEAALDAPPPGA